MNLHPRGTLLAALSILLGACSILPKAEAPNVYLLPAAPASAGVGAGGPTARFESLRVDTPQAGRALDGSGIAVVPAGNVITVYQGARWSDRAPRLLRDRLLDAFRADGRYPALSSDDTQLQAELELAGDLRAFQTEYVGGQPVVVIRYDAQLVQPRSRRILASRRFEIRQPVDGKAVPQVVLAFGQAADRLSAQLVDWVSAARSGER